MTAEGIPVTCPLVSVSTEFPALKQPLKLPPDVSLEGLDSRVLHPHTHTHNVAYGGERGSLGLLNILQLIPLLPQTGKRLEGTTKAQLQHH